MAKVAGKVANLTINSVAIEDDANSIKLSVKQTNPDATGLSDAGPRRTVDNYDYTLDIGGFADFASGQSDATLFGLVGSAGVATGYDPTGDASPGVSAPHYDSTNMVLETYELSTAVGKTTEFSCTLAGNSALSRTTA